MDEFEISVFNLTWAENICIGNDLLVWDFFSNFHKTVNVNLIQHTYHVLRKKISMKTKKTNPFKEFEQERGWESVMKIDTDINSCLKMCQYCRSYITNCDKGWRLLFSGKSESDFKYSVSPKRMTALEKSFISSIFSGFKKSLKVFLL